MTALLVTCLVFLFNMLLSALEPYFNSFIPNLVSYGLDVDYMIDTAVGLPFCSTLYKSFASFGLIFLTAMFLKKGFETYIAYTDGDPESDPIEFFTLYCKGIVVTAISPIIIDFFGDVLRYLIIESTAIINIAWAGNSGATAMFRFTEDGLESNLIIGLVVIIYYLIVFIFQFILIGTGVELLILQIGLPLATVGLLNQDKGVFKSYVSSLVKVFVTILTRVLLIHLSYVLVMLSGQLFTGNGLSGNFNLLVIGIAVVISAFKMPKLLSEWLVPSGGGQGIMMKAYYASGLISKLRK